MKASHVLLACLLAMIHFFTVIVLAMTVFLRGFVHGLAWTVTIFGAAPPAAPPRTWEFITLNVLTQPAGAILEMLQVNAGLWIMVLNSLLWGIALAWVLRMAWRAVRKQPESEQPEPLDE